MSRHEKIENGIASGDFIRRKDGVVVCSFCGGNCGQCGYTDVLGNVPASMSTMVESLHGQDRKPLIERLKGWLL